MFKRNLFSKIIILVVPLIIIAAVLTGLGLGLISKYSFLNTIKADYRVAAARASRYIELYFNSAFQEITAAASFVSAVRLDNWRTHMALTELRHKFPHFQYMALVDLKGYELANSWFNQDLYNRDAWRTFQDAAQGRLAYSRLVILDRLPVMFIAAPVYYDGRLRAVVWGRLNVKPVWDVVIQLKRDLNFGPDGHIYLVDNKNILVAGDEVSLKFGQKYDLGGPPHPSTPPPLDLEVWSKEKNLNTRDSETLKSLLKDQELRPDFWIADHDELKTIFLRSPIQGLSWTLYITQPYQDAFHFLYKGFRTSLILVLVVILLGAVLTWYTVRRVLAPIVRLREAVARAAGGDLTQPLEIQSQDEVGELAAGFNEMQTSLRAYIDRLVTATADLNHTKCLAILGTTASKVNHQVGNFLNNLVLAISILKADQLSDPSRTSLGIVEENTRQIQAFIERLHNFSRKAELNLTRWSSEPELERIIETHRGRAEKDGIQLTFQAQETPPVLGDRTLLEQALTNLLTNALEASSKGDRVFVSVQPEGDRVKIVIEDHGCGIPPENLDNVFTPFFTTKKQKGTGLGLALAQTVFQAHGGEVVIVSIENQGTTVTCWLPAAPPMVKNQDAVDASPYMKKYESEELPEERAD